MANKVVIALAVLGVAFFTNPSKRALDDTVRDLLKAEFSRTGAGSSDDFLTSLGSLGCAFAPDACATAVMASLNVKFTDIGIAMGGAVRTDSGAKVLDCVGAFTKWVCFPPNG